MSGKQCCTCFSSHQKKQNTTNLSLSMSKFLLLKNSKEKDTKANSHLYSRARWFVPDINCQRKKKVIYIHLLHSIDLSKPYLTLTIWSEVLLVTFSILIDIYKQIIIELETKRQLKLATRKRNMQIRLNVEPTVAGILGSSVWPVTIFRGQFGYTISQLFYNNFQKTKIDIKLMTI